MDASGQVHGRIQHCVLIIFFQMLLLSTLRTFRRASPPVHFVRGQGAAWLFFAIFDLFACRKNNQLLILFILLLAENGKSYPKQALALSRR